jgi:hypothetical protein
MSRLPFVNPSQAQGKTHDLFIAVKARMGRVPNLMKAMANALNVLTNYFNVAVETPIDFPIVGPLPA